MAGSYFQTATYGIKPVKLGTEVTTTEKFLGTNIGPIANIGSVTPIDLKADKQTYSLKQVLQVMKASEVSGNGLLTLSLYSKSTTPLTTNDKVLDITLNVADIAQNGSILYEVSLPSNCKRYVAVGIKKAESATISGDVLIVNKPIR